MIKIYRNTTKIQAEQFDGSAEMIDKYDVIDSEGAGLFLPTLEGNLEFHINDWIATGVKGEHWAIADKIFRQTYTELPVISPAIATLIDRLKFNGGSLFDLLGLATVLSVPDTYADWIHTNEKLVARAWLDGYVVEEEK